jgi:hypothetical protein
MTIFSKNIFYLNKLWRTNSESTIDQSTQKLDKKPSFFGSINCIASNKSLAYIPDDIPEIYENDIIQDQPRARLQRRKTIDQKITEIHHNKPIRKRSTVDKKIADTVYKLDPTQQMYGKLAESPEYLESIHKFCYYHCEPKSKNRKLEKFMQPFIDNTKVEIYASKTTYFKKSKNYNFYGIANSCHGMNCIEKPNRPIGYTTFRCRYISPMVQAFESLDYTKVLLKNMTKEVKTGHFELILPKYSDNSNIGERTPPKVCIQYGSLNDYGFRERRNRTAIPLRVLPF